MDGPSLDPRQLEFRIGDDHATRRAGRAQAPGRRATTPIADGIRRTLHYRVARPELLVVAERRDRRLTRYGAQKISAASPLAVLSTPAICVCSPATETHAGRRPASASFWICR